MASSKLKTKKTNKSISVFLNSIKSPEARKDSKTLIQLMEKATGKKAKLWGAAMIGFGSYQYKRRDGSEHEYFAIGFSPRKQNLTIYVMPGFKDNLDLLRKLGPHTKSVGCLYIKRLSDIDQPTLKKIIQKAVAKMKSAYKTNLN